MGQSNTVKAPLVFRVGVVLLGAVIVMISMMSSLYARYSTTATGEASARIANFDVQVTGDSADVAVDVSKATDNVYTITINNLSDVTVEYHLSASPIDGVSAAFDQTTGVLPFGADAVSRNLTFTVTDWDLLTKGMSGQSNSVVLDFTVSVYVEQVD